MTHNINHEKQKKNLFGRLRELPQPTSLVERLDLTANHPTLFRPLTEGEITGMQWSFRVVRELGLSTLRLVDKTTDTIDDFFADYPTRRREFPGARWLLSEQVLELDKKRVDWLSAKCDELKHVVATEFGDAITPPSVTVPDEQFPHADNEAYEGYHDA